MILREYQKGDIYKILKQDVEEMMTRYVREEVMLESLSFTGLINDKVIGCAGLFHLWEGVYEVWLAVDKEIRNNTKIVYRIIKTLKKALAELPFETTRLHAFVNERLPNNEHFMKVIGFEREAVLENYFPNGANCIVYRRFTGWPKQYH